MPAKKAPKVDAEDPEVQKRKMKRIKEILEGCYTELGLPLDTSTTKMLRNIYDSQELTQNCCSCQPFPVIRGKASWCHVALSDSQGTQQGWEYPGGPDEPVKGNKVVIHGELNKGIESPPAEASSKIKAVGRALKTACPLHCCIDALCAWHAPVREEGLKSILEFTLKIKPMNGWEGLTHLELSDCALTPAAGELLRDALDQRNALRVLILDFNPIGNEGLANIAQGLSRNTTVEVLRLAYCGLTSAAGPAIGAGIVRGSRVKVLDLHGNQLGRFVTRDGLEVDGFGFMHILQAMMNIRLFQSPTKKDLNETASSEGNSGVTEVEKKDQVLTEGQPSAVDPPAEAEIVDADASAQGTGDTLGGTNKVSVVEAVKDGNEAVVESASVQQLLEKFRCIAVQDGPEGTFRATAGEWKGSSLMVGAGELGEQTLDVLTETIEALDVSDNCITSDMEEGSASLFCAVGLDEAKLHVRESAVELGQARIFENCFCAIDREIFRVEEVFSERTVQLPAEIGAQNPELVLGLVPLGAIAAPP